MKTIRIGLLSLFCSVLFWSCQNEVADIVNSVHSVPVAEAGPPVTVTLPANATLQGSGVSANGRITGYLWSMISGPNTATIQTPGSATTVISNLVQGTYRFQLMVIDSLGYTGVDTTSVSVLSATLPLQTLTLQPTTNTNEFLFSGGPVLNQSGHSVDVAAGAWTSGGNTLNNRGALRFNLSSIPATATIVSAKLSLYSDPTPVAGDLINANSGTDNSFFIRRISANWTSAGSTWANQPPTTTTNQILIPHTAASFLDLIDVDVKNLVVDMRTSGDYGMMMQLQNEVPYNIRQFCSSYNTASPSTKFPKLVIVYQ